MFNRLSPLAMHEELRANRWLAGPRFSVLCVVQLWSAHAIAYLMHEYAHAFTAWLLGWKANPFALHYGDLSIANLLILTKIDENVDYAPIYAQGHGHLAALIAFAGSGIGSLLLYAMCRWLLSGTRLQLHPVWRLFAFWLCLMCVGNFYDYVPIRTFDPEGDVSYIVRGLQVSPWLVLVLLGIPTALAIYQFFATLLPQTLRAVFPAQWSRQKAMLAVSAFLIFGFFGGSGFTAEGEVSKVLAGVSVFALFPAVILLCRRQYSQSLQ
jgi:hypothetical protein